MLTFQFVPSIRDTETDEPLIVPPSIFTCASSKFARVPDARDFNLKAVLEERGEIRSN